MAFVGSISGSSGLTAVTSSFVPSASTFNLGASTNKWGTVYANYMTASISSSDGTNPFLKAGPDITVNYNSIGQWEITGTAAAPVAAQDIFKAINSSTAYSTSSIAVGFNGAPSTKGSDVFFAVSGSNPAQSTSLFSGPVVTSGSLTLKDAGAPNTTVAYIDGLGNISGSSITTSGAAIVTGSLTVKSTISGSGNITTNANVVVNGGNITSAASTFNVASTSAVLNLGSSTGKVVVPGDFEVQGTTMTVDVTNLTVEDPLIGLGYTTGSVAGSDGDRGFIGGISGAGNSVAFAWSSANKSFVSTKTTSVPGDLTLTISDLQPIRASKFQVSGSTAEVKGNGSTLQLSGTQLDVFSSNNGITVWRDGINFLNITSGTYGASANAVNVVASGNGNAMVVGSSADGAIVSGSTSVALNASSVGIRFQRDGINMATMTSGSGASTSLSTGNSFTVGTTGATSTMNVSGSNGINLQSPALTGVSFFSDSSPMFVVSNPSSNTVSLDGVGSFSTINLGLVTAGTVNLSKAGSTTTVLGNLNVNGNVTVGDSNADRVTFNAYVTSSILPSDDVSFTLGDATHRWQHIYTGDLHLRNERGDYTLIEETDFLSIRFNKTGKRYKFVLERVPELDE